MTAESGGEIPYKLTIGTGVTPTDIGWIHASRLPMDRYEDLYGEPYDGPGNSRFVSLQMVGLGERESAMLADVNQETLLPHKQTLDRMRNNLVHAGLEEEEAKHLVNVFALGILVGSKVAEVTEQYANQGIKDIEENLWVLS